MGQRSCPYFFSIEVCNLLHDQRGVVIMRIDKFLKNSRIIKRRTVAKEACEQGRIFLNDKLAKPGAEVQEGDEIFVQFGNGSLRIEVTALLESCRKEDAARMYKVIE